MKMTFIISVFTTLLSFGAFAQSYYPTYPSTTNQRSSGQSSYGTYNTPTQTSPNTRYQEGYIRDNGTYVQPHMKTQSNNTNLDNYSTYGNTNPYTQQQGTRARDYSTESYNYGQGQQIQTGSRGGQYYINSNGNKTYVPKRNPY